MGRSRARLECREFVALRDAKIAQYLSGLRQLANFVDESEPPAPRVPPEGNARLDLGTFTNVNPKLLVCSAGPRREPAFSLILFLFESARC